MVLDKGDIKWTYGTYFNVSPLGYELYLTNYLNLEGRLYSLYVKTGRPYKNIGAGFSLSELYRLGRFSVGSSCDVWMQDVYGNGAAVTLSSDYRVFDNAGLTMKAGWKEQGYAVGRRVEESSLVLAGFFYRF